MSIIQKIGRGTAFVSVATFLARLGTFAGNIAIIRLLNLGSVGRLGLIESWMSVATLFAALGINAAATKFLAEYIEDQKERAGQVVGAALVLSTTISLLAGVAIYIGFAVGWLHTPGDSSDPLSFAPVLACLVVILSLRLLMNGLVYGCQAFSALVPVNVVLGLASFPVMYSLVAARGLAGALEAKLFLTLLECVLLARVVSRSLQRAQVPVSLCGLRAQGRLLLSYGLPSLIGDAAAGPVQPIMLSVLSAHPGGIVQVALITTASRLCSMVNFLPATVASTLTPILSSEWGAGKPDEFRRSLTLALRLFWLGTMPLIVFFLAAAPVLLKSLYGREFVAAWPVAWAMLGIALITSLNQTADRALAAANRIWLSTSNNFVWLLLFIPCALWAMARLGALGYAGAFEVTFAFYVGLQMWWLRRVFGIPLRPIGLMVGLSMPFVAASLAIAFTTTEAAQVASASALLLAAALFEWRFLFTNEEKAALMRRVQVKLGRSTQSA